MDRRRFLLISLGGVFPIPLTAEAQRAGKTYRVAYLSNSAERTPVDAAFLDALRDLG